MRNISACASNVPLQNRGYVSWSVLETCFKIKTAHLKFWVHKVSSKHLNTQVHIYYLNKNMKFYSKLWWKLLLSQTKSYNKYFSSFYKTFNLLKMYKALHYLLW